MRDFDSHKAISFNPVRDCDSHKDRIDSTQHKAKQALTAKSDCPQDFVVENPKIYQDLVNDFQRFEE